MCIVFALILVHNCTLWCVSVWVCTRQKPPDFILVNKVRDIV